MAMKCVAQIATLVVMTPAADHASRSRRVWLRNTCLPMAKVE